jgi:Mrp family chromosome partitioning ATPase
MTSKALAKGQKQTLKAQSKSAKKVQTESDDGLFTSWLSPPSQMNGSTSTLAPPSPLHLSGLLDQFPAPLVESLRYLVSRFQLGQNIELPTRLGVVSALHGEGVTTVSRTLAAVIANDLDVPVCWVDLSWPSARSPSAAETNGADGVYEVLTGGMELAAALRKTVDPRLVILPAGRVPEAQREALARSPLLATLIDHLEKQFDCVVFDMPPILAGSAGLGLIRHTDSYLLVVRHGVTTAHQLRAVADELRSVRSIGVVLNRYKSRIPKWLAHYFVS